MSYCLPYTDEALERLHHREDFKPGTVREVRYPMHDSPAFETYPYIREANEKLDRFEKKMIGFYAQETLEPEHIKAILPVYEKYSKIEYMHPPFRKVFIDICDLFREAIRLDRPVVVTL
ncbi:MAG: hypothetical protein AAFX94_09600 [Myxococcota bacterium]